MGAADRPDHAGLAGPPSDRRELLLAVELVVDVLTFRVGVATGAVGLGTSGLGSFSRAALASRSENGYGA